MSTAGNGSHRRVRDRGEEHPDGARLVELLLARTSAAEAELARLGADPDTRAELASLARVLARARAAAEAESVLDAEVEEALIRRITAATVGAAREERRAAPASSSRRRALVRSRAALAAAACVAAAALFVPAIGLFPRHGAASEPRPSESVEPRRAALAAKEAAAAPAPPPAEGERVAWKLEDQRARDRYPLSEDVVRDAPLAIRLLDARARFLCGGAWDAWLDEPRVLEELEGEPAGAAPEQDGHGVSIALLAELMLDRYARDGERSARFQETLGRLARRAEAAAGAGAEARLLEAALERARAYRIEPLAGDALAKSGPAEPTRDPLGSTWRSLLHDALGPELARHPVAMAWTGSAR